MPPRRVIPVILTPAAAEALAARPAAPRGEDFSYDLVFDHLYGELAEVEAELGCAEIEYGAAEIRVTQLRRKRERATSRLYASHRPIERFCRSQPDLKGAGIVGPTPESPDALAHQVALTVEFLRVLESDAAARRNATALAPGVRIDAGVLADDLEPGLLPLENAIAAEEEAEVIVYIVF